MADQWWYYPKCGVEFPCSEMKDHKHGSKWSPRKTDSQTEEGNQDEDSK